MLAQIRAMWEWVLEVEQIFDASWASRPEEMISNAEVGRRLDDWLHRLSTFLESDQRTEVLSALQLSRNRERATRLLLRQNALRAKLALQQAAKRLAEEHFHHHMLDEKVKWIAG